jgi:hypothetical protein
MTWGTKAAPKREMLVPEHPDFSAFRSSSRLSSSHSTFRAKTT